MTRREMLTLIAAGPLALLSLRAEHEQREITDRELGEWVHYTEYLPVTRGSPYTVIGVRDDMSDVPEKRLLDELYGANGRLSEIARQELQRRRGG